MLLSKLAPLTALILPLLACSKASAPTHAAAAGPVAVPVTVASVVQRTMPVQLRAIGNVLPYRTVSVRCEVGGQLQKAAFTEGQDVHRGDVLFIIDPRPFQAALQQAQANLEKDQAAARNAQVDAGRYEQLFKAGVIPRQQYDQYRTTSDTLTATVAADQAAVETARLQLSYTTVHSPIDGRTGSLLVHPGNLVQANSTILVVINQVQPIFVSFSVPAQNLPEIKRYMPSGLHVEAQPKEGGVSASGLLTFIDNTVDLSTGTIMLKGTFQNEKRSLWPGQFVDVILNLTRQPNALVVPSQAIQNGQQGQFVFVVKSDATVEARQVTVSRTIGQQSVISSGLAPGETVVTDGQLRLAPGAKVRIVPARKG
jgi:membrane fusion protein, multidrug efflux system